MLPLEKLTAWATLYVWDGNGNYVAVARLPHTAIRTELCWTVEWFLDLEFEEYTFPDLIHYPRPGVLGPGWTQ